MTNQKPRITGAIFQNQYPTGPLYSGFIEIDGVKTEIALWEKVAKTSGKSYLQVSENKKRQQPPPGPFQSGGYTNPPNMSGGGRGANTAVGGNQNHDMDEDIPF